MSHFTREFAKTVNRAGNFLSSIYNIASGQALLDYIAGPDARTRGYHDDYHDNDGVKIYSKFNRDFSKLAGNIIGGVGFTILGIAALGSGLGLPAALAWAAAGGAIPALGAPLAHATIAGTSYGLRKLYNDGAKAIEEEREMANQPPPPANDDDIDAATTEGAPEDRDDYNGPGPSIGGMRM